MQSHTLFYNFKSIGARELGVRTQNLIQQDFFFFFGLGCEDYNVYKAEHSLLIKCLHICGEASKTKPKGAIHDVQF